MDHSVVALRAAAKAMNDVIIPATLDAGDAQAVEQAHLVRDLLTLLEQRVDLIAERRHFEVRHYLALVRSLGEDPSVCRLPVASAVHAVTEEVTRLLTAPSTSASAMIEAVELLTGTVRAVLDESGGLDVQDRGRIERMILTHERHRVQVDRAWLLPYGFDPDPATAPDLEVVLTSR